METGCAGVFRYTHAVVGCVLSDFAPMSDSRLLQLTLRLKKVDMLTRAMKTLGWGGQQVAGEPSQCGVGAYHIEPQRSSAGCLRVHYAVSCAASPRPHCVRPTSLLQPPGEEVDTHSMSSCAWQPCGARPTRLMVRAGQSVRHRLEAFYEHAKARTNICESYVCHGAPYCAPQAPSRHLLPPDAMALLAILLASVLAPCLAQGDWSYGRVSKHVGTGWRCAGGPAHVWNRQDSCSLSVQPPMANSRDAYSSHIKSVLAAAWRDDCGQLCSTGVADSCSSD
jgi:hypothetical protein